MYRYSCKKKILTMLKFLFRIIHPYKWSIITVFHNHYCIGTHKNKCPLTMPKIPPHNCIPQQIYPSLLSFIIIIAWVLIKTNAISQCQKFLLTIMWTCTKQEHPLMIFKCHGKNKNWLCLAYRLCKNNELLILTNFINMFPTGKCDEEYIMLKNRFVNNARKL